MLQDGDIETPDSRWSCKPELGSAGMPCSITYALPDPQYIEELNIGERELSYPDNDNMKCFV